MDAKVCFLCATFLHREEKSIKISFIIVRDPFGIRSGQAEGMMNFPIRLFHGFLISHNLLFQILDMLPKHELGISVLSII